MSSELWGVVSLGMGEAVRYGLGDLTLRLRRRSDEVWIHADHLDEGGGGEAPEGGPAVSRGPAAGRVDGIPPGEWIRWAIPSGEELALEPALPDRAVVVSPEQPFFLPPDGRARIFVRIPLFVRIRTTGKVTEAATLDEFPSLVLSDTWWGTFTEGELAYWLDTKARREVPPEVHEPHLAVCTLALENRSLVPLPVERFAVRVAYLSLFRSERAVWTDEVRVRYEGGHEGSEIRYTGRAPRAADGVTHLMDSREPAPRGLRAMTFGRLRGRVGAL